MRPVVAILVFPDVEVLDFAGPFEVFAVADELGAYGVFQVVTVAPDPGPVRARNGLQIVPDHTLETCPAPSLLVVPGGFGTRALAGDARVLAWIRSAATKADLVMSVCTGSILLGRAGLLDGLKATTHAEVVDLLREAAPGAIVDTSQRFHDNGRILTAAGISAGIDCALHVVGKRLGTDAADRVAQYMEYGAHAQGTRS
jgi:transcriptional regulator GlxA family with amidase domain